MYQIRLANKNDVSDILEIMNEIILNSLAMYDIDPKAESDVEQWLSTKNKNKFPVIVLTSEDKVIGYATYDQFRPRQGYKSTIEHSVHLNKSYRGKGLGKSLLKEIIEYATKEGYFNMIGGMDKTNTKSIELHKKLGFKKVGEIPFVARKFDRWLTLELYSKLLK